MHIRYLKYVKKWLSTYKGNQLCVGNSISEVINDSIKIIEASCPIGSKYYKTN